jgi:hypothetical protein
MLTGVPIARLDFDDTVPTRNSANRRAVSSRRRVSQFLRMRVIHLLMALALKIVACLSIGSGAQVIPPRLSTVSFGVLVLRF